MADLYIMDVTFLSEQEQYEKALAKVDRHRKNKAEHCAKKEDKCRSLAAGILLQYVRKSRKSVGDMEITDNRLQAVSKSEIEREDVVGTALHFIQNQDIHTGAVYMVTCEPDKLDEPVEDFLEYGENGKPYLKDSENCYVNLSHSGDFVICAVSDREVGADIQQIKEETGAKIAARFCTQAEQEWLQQQPEQDRRSCFYRLWAAKESYIKLTGKGMKQNFCSFTADPDKKMVTDHEKGTEAVLTEITGIPGYAICMCESF